jgi:hypothetical protein
LAERRQRLCPSDETSLIILNQVQTLNCCCIHPLTLKVDLTPKTILQHICVIFGHFKKKCNLSLYRSKKPYLDLLSKFLDMMSLDQYLATKDEGKVIYNPSNIMTSYPETLTTKCK